MKLSLTKIIIDSLLKNNGNNDGGLRKVESLLSAYKIISKSPSLNITIQKRPSLSGCARQPLRPRTECFKKKGVYCGLFSLLSRWNSICHGYRTHPPRSHQLAACTSLKETGELLTAANVCGIATEICSVSPSNDRCLRQETIASPGRSHMEQYALWELR